MMALNIHMPIAMAMTYEIKRPISIDQAENNFMDMNIPTDEFETLE